MIHAQPDHCKPKVEFSGNVIILTFTDGKNRAAENPIAQELAALADDIGPHHLLLDFTNMSLISSVELGTLIGLNKRIRMSGGRLTLFNLGHDLYEVFEVTRLHTLLEICRQSIP